MLYVELGLVKRVVPFTVYHNLVNYINSWFNSVNV